MATTDSVYFKFKITRSRHLETHMDFGTIYNLDCFLPINIINTVYQLFTKT